MSQDPHNNCPVDPRIQVELEKLNTATDNINKFEVELDEAKNDFKQLLVESVDRIKQSSHKLNNAVQTAKPYYEARLYASQLRKEHQIAAANHERARSVHAVAKEMVYLAEQGLGETSTLDTACQEMLSHAASRVNESQLEFTDTKNTMKICELKQDVANARVLKLQAQLKGAIKASRPYYETRANYNGKLKAQKDRITDLEGRVRDAKMTYNEALRLLEQISEEIHRQRNGSASDPTSTAINDDDDDGEQSAVAAAEAFATANNTPTLPDGTDEDEMYPPYQRLSSQTSSTIFSADEYLEFPERLSTNASPIRAQSAAQHDCPHLLRDLPPARNPDSSAVLGAFAKPEPYELNSERNPAEEGPKTDPSDIEQWTEIRLSNSASSSSGYSQRTGGADSPPNDDDDGAANNSDSADERPRSGVRRSLAKIALFGGGDAAKTPVATPSSTPSGEGIASWISKTNLKQSGRRQSLDILLDAGDRVKDVFANGFQRVGKSLERRSSESEVSGDSPTGTPTAVGATNATGLNSALDVTPVVSSTATATSAAVEFFSFGGGRSQANDVLTDEQIENLLLSEDCAEMLRSVLNISK